jgi:ABC-2 type transport system ATP-binding protein
MIAVNLFIVIIKIEFEKVKQMVNAISLINVTKIYKSKKMALSNLNLDIPQGSVFGLLGPNGAGKSTVINILAGLTNKSDGKVYINGIDQDKNPRKSKESIGVVPQELNFDPFLSPKESLEVQAGLYGVCSKNRKTIEILKAVGLSDVANAYARSLSGGMRRRLLMAKALVHNPPILILDEPTAGVDIELREMLWEFITKLNRNGTTIVLTTHYLDEAQKMCDKIAILNNGNLVKFGETKDLLDELDEKVLVIQPTEEIKKLPIFPNYISAKILKDGTISLSFKRTAISTGKLIELCGDLGISIKDVATTEPALEDIFKIAIR